MLNKFTGYESGRLGTKPPSFEFKTLEDLLNLDVMQRYANTPGFTHFTINHDCIYRMGYDNFDWCLIGSVKYTDGVELTKFPGSKYKVILGNGVETVLLDRDIKCIIDDIITLKNGTRAIKI